MDESASDVSFHDNDESPPCSLTMDTEFTDEKSPPPSPFNSSFTEIQGMLVDSILI